MKQTTKPGKPENGKICGPPWAPKDVQKPLLKTADPLEEKITKIEKETGKKLTERQKDYLGNTMALVKSMQG